MDAVELYQERFGIFPTWQVDLEGKDPIEVMQECLDKDMAVEDLYNVFEPENGEEI